MAGRLRLLWYLSRMSNLALTKSKHLLPFAAALSMRGISVRRLLRKANLPVTCLDDPDTLIPAICEGPFRELAAQAIGCPNISLEVTQSLEIGDLGDFGRAILMQPTVNGSLHKFRELVGTETSNLSIELRPQPNGDLWFGQRMLSHAGSGAWHDNLYIISWMLKVAQLADPAWSPTEILIASQATRKRFEAIEILGSTARFQRNYSGFMIPASMLAQPIKKNSVVEDGIDADLWSTAPPGTYAESLKHMIQTYADDRWLSIDQASEIANTSVRTMQRRLSTDQQTYSNLVQQCREEIAGDLIENTDASIAEIAHQLGYKHQGDFTHAFYRWAKVSPSDFRKQRSLIP